VHYDFVIVGAGSAGCILADRLSASGRHSVLVIEAGGRGRSPWLKLPLGYGKTFFDPKVNWKYQTEPEPALNGRRGYWPRGKVVGGSGAINALVYARGLPDDYDDWAASGATGWAWRDVAPAFSEIETRVRADGHRTGTGPITVQDVSDQVHPLSRHFFAAARDLGHPVTHDCNGTAPEGATTYRVTTRAGLRASSAEMCLKPALARSNLTLHSGALVDRVAFDGARAVAVHYRTRGQPRIARARREIILAAGAIGSPAILQRSGVGAPDTLEAAGITVHLDQPKVGAELQDHLGINYTFRACEPTLNGDLAPLGGKLRAALRYALTRRGPLALSVNQCGGFFRSAPGATRADQQIYFNPVSYTTTPKGRRSVVNPDPFPGFILGFQPTRPTSRGTIAVTDADPASPPRITPNSLASAADRAGVIAGARLCQQLLATAPLDRLVAGPKDSDPRDMDDAALLEDFRARCGTVFHPVGTCRMGRDAETCVVDSRLRLHGAEGLRVIDASVFPAITSGNTNAPTMMVAWRAAGFILEET
jgi:choline dehydrogenase